MDTHYITPVHASLAVNSHVMLCFVSSCYVSSVLGPDCVRGVRAVYTACALGQLRIRVCEFAKMYGASFVR